MSEPFRADLLPPEEARGIHPVYIALERSIGIARSPTEVWPYVVDYPAWQDYARRDTLFGERDCEGELVLLQKAEQGVQGFPPYYARTVQIVQNERFVWKTFPAMHGDFHDFFGLVEFGLHPIDGGTEFSMATTYEFLLREKSNAEIEAFKATTYGEFLALVEKLLAKLKALAES